VSVPLVKMLQGWRPLRDLMSGVMERSRPAGSSGARHTPETLAEARDREDYEAYLGVSASADRGDASGDRVRGLLRPGVRLRPDPGHRVHGASADTAEADAGAHRPAAALELLDVLHLAG